MTTKTLVTPKHGSGAHLEGAACYPRFADVSRLSDSIAAVESVNKKAARLGVPGIDLLRIGDVVIRHRSWRSDDKCRWTVISETPSEFSKPVEMVRVALVGCQPRIDGHKILGIVDFLGEGDDGDRLSVIRPLPGTTENLSSFVKADSVCDHCETHRQRNSVAIIRRIEDGATLQVGISCLAHYAGGRDMQRVIALWAEVFETFSSDEPDDEKVDRSSRFVATRRFLPYVARSIRVDGWASKKSAEISGQTPTSMMAMGAMWNEKPEETPTRADVIRAYRAIVWARKLSPRNDFESSMHSIARAGILGPKHFGIAAAIVAAYSRHRDDLALRRGLFDGWNRNAVIRGDGRRSFRVRFVGGPREVSSAYGVTFLVKFLDLETGALLTSFASEGIIDKMPPTFRHGSEFTIKATLTGKTNLYQGAYETSISRIAWPEALATAT